MVRVLAVWVTLLVCLIDVGQFVRWEKIRKGYYKEFSELTAEVQEEDVVFSDHEHIQICLSWYLNQDAVGDAADLTSYLEKTDGNSNRQVWYFSSVQDRGVESEIEKYYDGNEIENVGEYHLENYTFSVKRMKKENV